MNLQSILNPIADFFQWTFYNILEPIAPYFNWICIVFAFVAITYWLMRQRNYNRKAASEGTTM